ncbi:SDR family NAD(P)-dependent oxidoreductase [Mangrovimicrobium sediminis]|uniref:SDR family NAD(P)-dependent oxidoreductase n=1 Tax=Mangrovimicrobium sediminis TaxID=2562682 RepID=A0A4Z0LYC6_9GAMM|nr:SDR family NAD(P)-dependent oxidoreductase [Haliea sp. SAOS-164]TGD72240.1 SDR family NAD(P)-dependent oxidoreductase [Haliea sp. SAOS-164]
MARIFITGSTDGLGFLAAEELLQQGHEVVLHARNADRARDVVARLPTMTPVVIGDLAQLAQMVQVAEQVNHLGQFDAIIHNAGLFTGDAQGRVETEEGLPSTIAVNVLAPYVLTALIHRPQRLVYLASSMHEGASADLSDLEWKRRQWNSSAAYSQSKLCVVMLALAVARFWPEVNVNAVDPGWVPTRMGGPSAPDDLREGILTQTWLAAGDDASCAVSGQYFFHRQRQQPDAAALEMWRQEALLSWCCERSGITLAGGG